MLLNIWYMPVDFYVHDWQKHKNSKEQTMHPTQNLALLFHAIIQPALTQDKHAPGFVFIILPLIFSLYSGCKWDILTDECPEG